MSVDFSISKNNFKSKEDRTRFYNNLFHFQDQFNRRNNWIADYRHKESDALCNEWIDAMNENDEKRAKELREKVNAISKEAKSKCPIKIEAKEAWINEEEDIVRFHGFKERQFLDNAKAKAGVKGNVFSSEESFKIAEFLRNDLPEHAESLLRHSNGCSLFQIYME